MIRGSGLPVTFKYCSHNLTGNEGFLSRGGILTFLKSTTQLLIWFDDVLEVTWVYEDSSDTEVCQMRKPMTALKFHTKTADTASVQYRYGLKG